ncbi:MAG: (Fe-S)-binding protein, partial [Chloroflexi bacterium]|nr:(Fe-S)-binding protein [Chloroflexota bacterium]
MLSEAWSRAIFWLLFIAAFGIFINRAIYLYRLMRLGQPENRFDRPGKRLSTMLYNILPQSCSLKSLRAGDFAGLGHALIFWGFSLFLINYIVFLFISDGFGLPGIRENIAARYFTFALDIAGAIVALAIVWAAIRRYLMKPVRLAPSGQAAVIMAAIFLLMIGHFSIEGFGIAAGGSAEGSAQWMPVGNAFASFYTALGAGAVAETGERLSYWLHYFLLVGFLVYIGYSKHLHIMASFPNIFFSNLGPRGALTYLDLEKATSYGVSRVNGFTWKQLLDAYACTQCGRCHANCPAQVTGKPLSPRDMMVNLKKYLLHEGPALLAAARVKPVEGQEAPPQPEPREPMIGSVMSEEALWSCTTCRSCQEQCPTLIEHINKIVDMRRSLVMEQASLPELA